MLTFFLCCLPSLSMIWAPAHVGLPIHHCAPLPWVMLCLTGACKELWIKRQRATINPASTVLKRQSYSIRLLLLHVCIPVLDTSYCYLRMTVSDPCQPFSTSMLQAQVFWIPSFLNWFKQCTFSFAGITLVFGKSLSPQHVKFMLRQLDTITELGQTQNQPKAVCWVLINFRLCSSQT